MIVAPRTIEDFKNMKFEDLIKEKHKLMKKIITTEKQIYLEKCYEIEDPSPEIYLIKYNEELDVINNIIEEKVEKKNNKGIFI